MRFADPWWLATLGVLPIWCFFRRRVSKPSLNYSDVSLLLAPTVRSWRQRTCWSPTAIWLLGVAAAIAALARPQVPDDTQTRRQRGRAVSLVVDVSGSMGKTLAVADGRRTSRLDKVKEIIDALLQSAERDHPNDEFGLTVFAAEPRVLSPATVEQAFVSRKLREVDVDSRDNRTEIGAGIALGIDVIRNWPEGQAALILFTDGAQRVENGLGPLAGARVAEAFGIPIVIVHFADDPEEMDDRTTLSRVAQIAKGRLIHWPDASPDAILQSLPPPRPMDASLRIWRGVYREWIATAMALLVAAAVLRRTIYATLPFGPL